MTIADWVYVLAPVVWAGAALLTLKGLRARKHHRQKKGQTKGHDETGRWF